MTRKAALAEIQKLLPRLTAYLKEKPCKTCGGYKNAESARADVMRFKELAATLTPGMKAAEAAVILPAFQNMLPLLSKLATSTVIRGLEKRKKR